MWQFIFLKSQPHQSNNKEDKSWSAFSRSPVAVFEKCVQIVICLLDGSVLKSLSGACALQFEGRVESKLLYMYVVRILWNPF
jgi:hypothetical protein